MHPVSIRYINKQLKIIEEKLYNQAIPHMNKSLQLDILAPPTQKTVKYQSKIESARIKHHETIEDIK